MTYSYKFLDGETQTIKDIAENKNEVSKNIIDAKKPLIILGESFLNTKSANYLFYSLKKFLLQNNKFTGEWNPLNLLSTSACSI